MGCGRGFQSHNGSIVTGEFFYDPRDGVPVSIPQWFDCDGFPATTLKQGPSVSIPQWFDCDKTPPPPETRSRRKFQSHNGSIVTSFFPLAPLGSCQFQSHNGSIVTNYFRHRPDLARGFQSHNGSIVTGNPPPYPGSSPGTFQSHNGSIVTRTACGCSRISSSVSIPQWFDCDRSWPRR